MKHPYPSAILSIHALCQIGMLLVFIAPQNGMAASQAKKIDVQAEMRAEKLKQEIRADFIAAMKAVRSEEYDKAIELLNRVAAQSTNNPVPYINLALIYKKQGNFALAEEKLKLAIIMSPDNPVASNEYGLLLRKMGRFAEARKIYENILEKHPDFTMAHKNLGILCDIYLRDYQCALKHYAVYSDAMPGDGAVKIWIADLRGR